MKKPILIAVLLALAAAALYVTRLDTAPLYPARDEVISGNLAQSIYTTGNDLDGNHLPLFLGEPTYHPGRDPILVYATAALLAFMPLSELAVRLPNAIVGVLDIILMFFVARRLFKSDAFGVVAAVLLAISPAHFMHSRLGVSLLLPLPFALLWLLCMTAFLDSDREQTARRRLAWGAFWLGLGVYGYLASVMLMPVYLLCSAWIAMETTSRDVARRWWTMAIAFIVPIVPLVIWEIAHPARFHDMITIYHPYAPQFGPLQGLKEMLSFFSLSGRVANYWTNIGPGILFFDDDASFINSTRAAGVFLWPFAFLFGAGVYRILSAERSRFSLALLIGFLTAPLPQVLTLDVGIRRSLVMVVFGVLIAMYGVRFLLASARPALVRIAAIALLVVLPFSFRTFYRDYTGDYQARAAYWFGNNIRGMWVNLMTLHARGETAPVYLSNKTPYLAEYGAFYLAGHAREDLLPDTHYYTPDEFKAAEQPPRSLLVVAVNENPSPASLASAGWAPVKTVSEPTGQPVFLIYEKK